MLKDNFKEYCKTKMNFTYAKYELTKEIREARIERYAANLKQRILEEMLECGDIGTLKYLPTEFHTKSTQDDMEYTELAEGAAKVGEYLKANGFNVDVQWDKNHPNGRGHHRAVIYFLDENGKIQKEKA